MEPTEIRRLLDVMPASDDDKIVSKPEQAIVIDTALRCPGIRSDRYLLILICGVVLNATRFCCCCDGVGLRELWFAGHLSRCCSRVLGAMVQLIEGGVVVAFD